jgi:hypothetical protein
MRHFASASLVIVLSSLFTPLLSQSRTTGFSVNPKAGIYMAKDEAGAVMGAEASYLRNGWMFSVDFYQFGEIEYLSSDEDMFRQLGLMAGKYYGDRLVRVQLQGGIAPIWQIGPRGDSEPDKFTTVGLTLKTGFKLVPLPFFGIGIDLQGNINSGKTIFMPLISLEFGRLREKINNP